jgi:hypothetical protein
VDLERGRRRREVHAASPALIEERPLEESRWMRGVRRRSPGLLLGFGLVFCGPSLGCGADATPGPASVEAVSPAQTIEVPDSCEAGTMPAIGSATCLPVGPRSCAEGFTTAASGWGCAPVLPSAPCTGATRAALGATSCVRVDDCTASFPPANAIVVHDDAELQAALATAKNGATIALDAGSYGGIEVPARLTALDLIGRCAETVKVSGASTRGLYVADRAKVSVRSITFEGFDGAIVAAGGAQVTASKIVAVNNVVGFAAGVSGASVSVSDSVAEITRAPAGKTAGRALAANQSGSVLLENSEVRGYPTLTQTAETGTKITVRRSTMTDLAVGRKDARVLVLAGSETLFEESAFRFTSGQFAFVAREHPSAPRTEGTAAGRLRLVSTTVIHSGAEVEAPLSQVAKGAQVVLEGTTIEHRTLFAWAVLDASSTLTATGSVIRSPSTSNALRGALWVDRGALATLDGVAIIDAQQHAVLVTRQGARLEMKNSLIQDTLPGLTVTNPQFGALGVAISVASDATASVEASALLRSSNYSVLAAGNAQIELHRTLIDGTSRSFEGRGGVGVGAFVGTRLLMDDSLVRGSEHAAFVFADPDTVGAVRRTHCIGNPFGIILSEMTIVDATDDAQRPEVGQLLMFQNVFEGTDTMVREEVVPNPLLPSLAP